MVEKTLTGRRAGDCSVNVFLWGFGKIFQISQKAFQNSCLPDPLFSVIIFALFLLIPRKILSWFDFGGDMVSTYLVRKQVARRGCLVGLVKHPDKTINGNQYDAVAEAEAILAEADQLVLA